jgi:hypothetical protein
MMNQNASPPIARAVLAALPTRATRDNNNGNHTAFVNFQADPSASVVARRRQP